MSLEFWVAPSPSQVTESRQRDPEARVLVSFELLAQLLKFPPGTEIKAVRQEPKRPWTLDILLTSPSLNPTDPCDAVPIVNPLYQSNRKDGEHWDPSFVSWGQS